MTDEQARADFLARHIHPRPREAGSGSSNGSALKAARALAEPFSVDWQGTRRDTCYAVGEKMLTLNTEQAAIAWKSLGGCLTRLGDRDIPKFMELLAGINAATMVGGIGVQNDRTDAQRKEP